MARLLILPQRHLRGLVLCEIVASNRQGPWTGGPVGPLIITHRIHVWYIIHLHEWLIFMVNVGKYTSLMDPIWDYKWGYVITTPIFMAEKITEWLGLMSPPILIVELWDPGPTEWVLDAATRPSVHNTPGAFKQVATWHPMTFSRILRVGKNLHPLFSEQWRFAGHVWVQFSSQSSNIHTFWHPHIYSWKMVKFQGSEFESLQR